jgi:hypothetical protein
MLLVSLYLTDVGKESSTAGDVLLEEAVVLADADADERPYTWAYHGMATE